MKKYFLTILTFTVFTLIGLYPASVHAFSPNWQKGMSVTSRGQDDFGSETFRASIRSLAETGTTDVALIINYYQSNQYTTDINRGWDTPTDAALISAIDYIHSLGMHVTLKFHLETYDSVWRAYINPDNSQRDAWFGAYGGMLQYYAKIAQAHNVQLLVIGSELTGMATVDANPTNTSHWKSLIASLRPLYSGKLTYSANTGAPGSWENEKERIGFWGDLDFIGISAYYVLLTNTPSIDSFKQAWQNFEMSDIQPLSQKYQKPVLFTEVGYRSVPFAYQRPWDFWTGGPFDEQTQANLYEALISYWGNSSYMKGVYFWNWSSDPNNGGQGNTDYTPQRKLAISVLKRVYFGTNPTPPPVAATFQTSAVMSSGNATVGQPITITGSIKNTGNGTVFALTDIEIYSSAGIKVAQKFIDNQQFTAGETKQLSITWTPSSPGAYTIQIGVFAPNWSNLFLWNSSALILSIQQNSSTTPPPINTNGSIDVWWPTNNTSVSGAQPLKALLKNTPINDYQMYWQVDGDRLNLMNNSTVDYPHKEILIDVSSWNWRGAGPYSINFVAKDANGNVLGQQPETIFVR